MSHLIQFKIDLKSAFLISLLPQYFPKNRENIFIISYFIAVKCVIVSLKLHFAINSPPWWSESLRAKVYCFLSFYFAVTFRIFKAPFKIQESHVNLTLHFFLVLAF